MNSIAAIGIDIGGTAIKAGVVDADGEVLKWESVPTEAVSGKNALLAKILTLIKKYRDFGQKSNIVIKKIGIGTAGFVNFHEGSIAGATGNLPGWGGTQLKKYLEDSEKIPVVVDNDINMIAMGEIWLGAGRSYDNFVCIAIGTGIGGCLVLNKQPFRGRDGYAGLYGHHIIVHEGKSCNCGKRGCWEQYSSVTALKQLAREMLGEQVPMSQSPELLFQEARAGHKLALKIIDRYTEYVAVGLANVIHAFNPPAIVIGGAITAQGDFLFDQIRSHIQAMTLKVFFEKEPIDIVPALLGEKAGFIGAARLAMNTDKIV